MQRQEVGFAKTFLQALSFHRLPTRRRIVLALAARVGMAHGFRRSVARVGPGGTPVLGPDGRPLIDIIEELPASERFFAGGDTTVPDITPSETGDAGPSAPPALPAPPIKGDPIANAAWQIFVAFVIVVLCLPFAEGTLQLSQAHALAVFAMIFSGLVGSGLAYFLWFGIIGRIPAMTASLGVLSAPVIGVVSTALFLGEIPTAADVVGYVLIFAAAVCVLLPGR